MTEDDSCLLDLCARLFREPDRLTQAERISVSSPVVTPGLHAHRDVMQLDAAVGCDGGWRVAGGKCPAEGVTVAVFYPGDAHGYELRPRQETAETFSLKIRVGRSWPAVRRRIFPATVRRLVGEEPLLKALRRLARLPSSRAPFLAATLAEVLCLWPRAGASPGLTPREVLSAEPDARLEAALTLIDERPAHPPMLDELAQAASYSPRHFRRRFRAVYGMTPQAFVTVRRLARARELLALGHLNVTQVAETVGFGSIHSFSRWFRRGTGANPTEFRERQPLL